MPARSIAQIVAYPLRAVLAKAQRTSQGDYPAIELVVVEVTTSDGITGFGEGLARRGAAGYARLIDELLTPRLIGKDPADRRALWKADARRALGPARRADRRGDLGDRHRALGHCRQGGGRADPQAARRHGADAAFRPTPPRSTGSTTPRSRPRSRLRSRPASARSRSSSATRSRTRSRARKFIRKLAGDDIALYVDANWAYDVDDALIVGRALADLGYWLLRGADRAA